MTIGTPIGANSKSLNGSRPYFGSRPFTARLVGDPASVHLPPSTAPKASGIRNIEAGVLRRLAMAITPGIKTAVVTTLLMKAAIEEAVNIMMTSSLVSPSPASRWSLWPMASTTPVLKSAAEMTKKLVSVMITGSPNPRKAYAGERQGEQRQYRDHVHRQRLGHEQDYCNQQNDEDKRNSHFDCTI